MATIREVDVDALVDEVITEVIALQRDIHQHPEIGFDTVRTAALAAEAMRSAGIDVREGIGKTGVVGDIEVPGATRRIALRADMDALPMDEDSNLPHKSSIPGAAHMCGHDAHTAMLTGAARALASVRDRLPCSVRFIFQPNEEAIPGGATAMIADGCLEGVDRIFGMHVWPVFDTGHIGILEGPVMAQPDVFRIVIGGVGGHAAAPHVVIDPIVCAAQVVSAAQSIVSRNIDPQEACVLSFTQFHGGTADNVISEKVELRGTIRSFVPEVGATACQRLEEIATSVAKGHGCTAEVEFTEGYPVTFNDPEACAEARRTISAVTPITDEAFPVLGGEDFAYYGQVIPAAFLFLGNRDASKGIVHYCHHPRFQVDDAAMPIGVRSWVALALGAAETA
ncbi:MAG TPA: amidohydrolase [Planctomycetes bacterium]|nr:amidohydrolase [Planctomycetota bacterium]